MNKLDEKVLSIENSNLEIIKRTTSVEDNYVQDVVFQ